MNNTSDRGSNNKSGNNRNEDLNKGQNTRSDGKGRTEDELKRNSSTMDERDTTQSSGNKGQGNYSNE